MAILTEKLIIFGLFADFSEKVWYNQP
jgi:hypothetical protein